MDVATVIPVFNPKREYLDQVFESLASQTSPPAEVIVVDDGSDVTIRAPYPILRQPNAGISAARNCGIAATAAPLVHVLDQDELLAPTFYESLSAEFAAGVVAAFATMRFVDAAGRDVNYSLPPPGFTDPVDWFPALLKENVIGSSAALFRRTAWQEVGGFRPFRYVQDYRFWLDISRVGRFRWHDQVLAWHRRHEGQQTSDGRRHRRETIKMLATLDVPVRLQRRKWRTVMRHALRDR